MTAPSVRVGSRIVGPGHPVFVIAEIGINHNGCVETAKRLIDGAVLAGADAVKFQKRTPDLCVPRDQRGKVRDTPWGRMTYLDYKHRIEFGHDDYVEIDRYCGERGILWFASCWDEASVAFVERFQPPCYKLASASLTDTRLLEAMRSTGRPIMLSTGMSTMNQIRHAMSPLRDHEVLLAHCTSSYPCPPEEQNLLMIRALRDRFPAVPVGYSGHELDLAPTWAAVALGATFIERHVTLDRSMWGSDQAASIEVGELIQLVNVVRRLERSLGDGVKRVYESELDSLQRLRRVNGLSPADHGSAEVALQAS